MTAVRQFRTLIVAASLALAAPAIAESPAPAGVQVLVEQGKKVDGDQRKSGKDAQLSSKSTAPTRGAGARLQRKAPTAADAQSINQDFWIFDATTAIAGDLDGDGFYTRLELDLDADTVYDQAWVYAVVYLSLEGGDWIEYGETAVFDIYGTSGGDEYFFDADLVSGFPTGYYDVLIELYDDFDGRLVATFGPAQSADLFDLPLESETVDAPIEPIVVVTEEGGGSAGLGLLGLLSVALLWRRQRLHVADELPVITL
ncbi:MAG: choice-of-anchor H family protein [Pseudomonadota bacterium]